jgi:hypothetical protein
MTCRFCYEGGCCNLKSGSTANHCNGNNDENICYMAISAIREMKGSE